MGVWSAFRVMSLKRTDCLLLKHATLKLHTHIPTHFVKEIKTLRSLVCIIKLA